MKKPVYPIATKIAICEIIKSIYGPVDPEEFWKALTPKERKQMIKIVLKAYKIKHTQSQHNSFGKRVMSEGSLEMCINKIFSYKNVNNTHRFSTVNGDIKEWQEIANAIGLHNFNF